LLESQQTEQRRCAQGDRALTPASRYKILKERERRRREAEQKEEEHVADLYQQMEVLRKKKIDILGEPQTESRDKRYAMVAKQHKQIANEYALTLLASPLYAYRVTPNFEVFTGGRLDEKNCLLTERLNNNPQFIVFQLRQKINKVFASRLFNLKKNPDLVMNPGAEQCRFLGFSFAGDNYRQWDSDLIDMCAHGCVLGSANDWYGLGVVLNNRLRNSKGVDDLIVAILYHELAHFELEHYRKKLIKQRDLEMDPSLSAEQKTFKFQELRRQHELEADMLAVERQGTIEPTIRSFEMGMAEGEEGLSQEERRKYRIEMDWSGTHPHYLTRIEALRKFEAESKQKAAEEQLKKAAAAAAPAPAAGATS
jgi:hypothetical protein